MAKISKNCESSKFLSKNIAILNKKRFSPKLNLMQYNIHLYSLQLIWNNGHGTILCANIGTHLNGCFVGLLNWLSIDN